MPEAYQFHQKAASHDWQSEEMLQNLTIQSVPKPTPGPHSALVRIRAAALNFRDLLIVANSPLYPIHPEEGLSPCSDGAGEIEAVGHNSRWQVGDRVVLKPNLSWMEGDVRNFDIATALGGGSTEGTLRQYAVVQDEHLFPCPKNLSYEEAASIPTAGATAVNALFWDPEVHVQEGTTVLTQGTGGVSCFAIQLASAVGARVIATSSSDEKLRAAKAMGATSIINYRTHPQWADEVLRLTDGTGVDLVVDVAGAGTIKQSLKSARLNGVVCICGILTPSQSEDLIPDIMYGAKNVRGKLAASRRMSEQLGEMMEKYNIHPVIGKTFEWVEAHQAFEAMKMQNTVGKIVIKV